MKSFLLFSAVWLAGCSTPPTGPRLSSVTPARVSASVATPIVIRAEGLEYAISADLDRPSLSTFTLDLHVRLIGPQTVELLLPQRVSASEVHAQVSSRLMLGKYTLEVSTARGVSKLVDALEVADCLFDCERGPDDGGCFSWPDLDHDSYGKIGAGEAICPDDAGNRVGRSGDCRDEDPAAHPLAAELCNGLDDDCDGVVDNASCLPDAGWKVRRDTGGNGDDWRTATQHGRGDIWLAAKQRVYLRPGSGDFADVSASCANKLVSSWANPLTGVAYFGGEGVITQHSASAGGCDSPQNVNGTVVGIQGFGTRLYAATRDGNLIEGQPGSLSQRPGFTDGASVNDVQGASPASLFAVGSADQRPKIWRMSTDGGPFVDERLPGLALEDQALTAVWAVDDSLAYAVGARGALLERTQGAWHALPSADRGLSAVRAFGPGRVYAATVDGRVLRYNGASWEVLYVHPTGGVFTDITASAEDDIWVVGLDGLVVHWPD